MSKFENTAVYIVLFLGWNDLKIEVNKFSVDYNQGIQAVDTIFNNVTDHLNDITGWY